MGLLKLNDFSTVRIPDSEVINRILAGEKELFEILMRRYNQTLYRVVRGYTTSESDIEDIMQEAYLKAYEKLDQFRGGSAFSTWLIRIGMNEALQKFRKKKRMRFIDGDTQESTVNQVVTTELGPERRVINRETKVILEQAIDRLPEKYKLVFILHELEAMPREQIAQILELSESNLKVRLHRAKKMLKEELFKQSLTSAVFEFGDSRCDRLVELVLKLLR